MYEFDDSPSYWDHTHDEEGPAAMPLALTLEAITGCRRMRALRIDGGKRATAQQLPAAWTSLTALSSLHLQVVLLPVGWCANSHMDDLCFGDQAAAVSGRFV